MIVNGEFYRWYPDIKQTDLGKDTSNKFIDTLSMANPYCGLMNADYDGKCVALIESNLCNVARLIAGNG